MDTTRPGVAHQVFEQRELARAKFDGSPLAGRGARDEIEAEVPDGQLRRDRGAGGAADQGVHPRQQFGKREGLGQVVVPTCRQTGDAVVHRVPGAQDQHRGVDATLAHALDQAETIEVRQHQVDDGDVVAAGRGQVETGVALGGMIDDEARLT